MEQHTIETIDVTILPAPQKHPAIFTKFDALQPGDTFIIHNDHDPKPLYYQLLGERGNIFTWAYLEQGPQWWKVKIQRRPENEMETVGAIAAGDLRKAEVFKKYGIDFCCGGKKTLKEACEEKGLSLQTLESELLLASGSSGQRPLPFHEWEAGFLSDYIINTHHTYVRKSLPALLELAVKVNKVHGASHPELGKVQYIVNALHEEMMLHMQKEEKILFPYIKQLAAQASDEMQFFANRIGSVKNPVNMMEMEHDQAGKELEELRTVTSNYQIPPDACTSYSLLYNGLAEFEDDLKLHIHLENNILFPKAIQLERDYQMV